MFVSDLFQADDYAKGMIALGLKRGDTLTSMALVSAETLYLSVAAISIGVGYSVSSRLLYKYKMPTANIIVSHSPFSAGEPRIIVTFTIVD